MQWTPPKMPLYIGKRVCRGKHYFSYFCSKWWYNNYVTPIYLIKLTSTGFIHNTQQAGEKEGEGVGCEKAQHFQNIPHVKPVKNHAMRIHCIVCLLVSMAGQVTLWTILAVSFLIHSYYIIICSIWTPIFSCESCSTWTIVSSWTNARLFIITSC